MKAMAIVAMGALLAAGCAPAVPPTVLPLPPTSLADRQIQTRRYAPADEAKIQRAAAQVLQDLGFQIDESEARLGVIVASKTRDARDLAGLVRAVLVSHLLGVHKPTDRLQQIRASLVTRPAGSSEVAVRITFQRLAWSSDNALSVSESIDDPAVYQEFFDRLAQSVFLTAHGL